MIAGEPPSTVVEAAFADCFADAYRTRLVGGFDEPEYLEPDESGWAELRYRADYLRSSLHESAHWCLAGARRRQQRDFGYWYAGDGRDAANQALFEGAEFMPQAIERYLCEALAIPFRVSCDNLLGVEPDEAAFTQRVDQEYQRRLSEGWPPRALCLADALRRKRQSLQSPPG
jgi:elongation factor P hydroxylase